WMLCARVSRGPANTATRDLTAGFIPRTRSDAERQDDHCVEGRKRGTRWAWQSYSLARLCDYRPMHTLPTPAPLAACYCLTDKYPNRAASGLSAIDLPTRGD